MSDTSGIQDGHRARKRFGQNFLTDEAVIARIVSAIAPKAEDRLIEIGPGLGALTCQLIQPLTHLTVVELDRDIIPKLKERCSKQKTTENQSSLSKLTILEQDALTLDLEPLATEGPLRIAGNLPYNISTPLLFHLMGVAEQVRDQHFMLQKEVIDRMVASPGGRDFGRLSVMLQWRYRMDKLLDVPPEAFDPPPRVDSAVVRMIPHPPQTLAAVDRGVLSALVTAAFSQRRKLLRHSLGPWLQTQGYTGAFDLLRRAEEVSTAEYVALAQSLPEKPVRP
ncbi:ribosomal RNA small subunit methyltransferase A [mine drainage metagenome]|uniref:Ribosomal RNA small subunit methyltransferase A n=1 Tax=mine drainage metagenome TaxID=410659 RepID=A0A1J5PWD0_9ZZZZ